MLHRSLPLLMLLLGSTQLLSAQTTLPSVQEVYRVFQAKCTQGCHGNIAPDGGLDLVGSGVTELGRAINVAQKLVNVAPENTYAQNAGLKRVYPGRVDRSFLFKKINGGFEPALPALHILEGHPMPTSSAVLTNVEKEVVRQWILYGAKTVGINFDKAIIEDFYANGGEKSFPSGPPPAPAAGTGFQIKMGPFFLPPGGEVEYYQKYELMLPADVEVNALDMKFSGSSHHFITYNFTGTGATTIPHGLRLNANHSQINLVAAVQEALRLDLPQTTAFKWSKDLVLDLNSHYINYNTLRPYQCEVYMNVYTQPPGTAKQEMFATLLVKPDIPIANNGNTITHIKAEYQIGAGNIYIWGLMGHTHKYGTGYKVWKRLPNGQKGELIYDAACPFGESGCSAPWFDYRHIPIRYWSPLLPVKWSEGIIHEAKWVNDGPAAVNFGPTSDDEMMVLIAFYTLQPITVGTNDPPAASFTPLLLSPNPTSGQVQINFGENSTSTLLRVSDVAGQIVHSIGLSSGQPVLHLDLSSLPSGLYFLQTDDGRTGKLVID